MLSVSQDSRVCAALEGNLWDLWSRFGRGDGCNLHERDHALWFDTPLPCLPYNGVLRFTPRDGVERRIDELFEHYRRRNVPFVWLVHPTSCPADLDDRLRARGMEEAESCPGMFARLADLPPPTGVGHGIEIREVLEPAGVNELLDLIAWRWRVPPDLGHQLARITTAFEVGSEEAGVRAWVARRNGTPVAKVVLNVTGDVAGVYGVATKPEARGLGVATALTLEAFHAARCSGAELGVLHSTPVATGLYERLGFRYAAPFRIFTPPQMLHL